jgi:mono/diheme cytochrome c family protein
MPARREWTPSVPLSIGLVSIEPNIPKTTSRHWPRPSLPFLWNAPQGSWTQWRGVQQDPINRNFTEVMGVYMLMDLSSKTPCEGLFSSSAAIENLAKIEELLQRLAPPKWPEEVFGKIDRNKAAAGKSLFMTHCAGCHTLGRIHGLHRTSMASVTSRSDWFLKVTSAPILISSRTCARTR